MVIFFFVSHFPFSVCMFVVFNRRIKMRKKSRSKKNTQEYYCVFMIMKEDNMQIPSLEISSFAYILQFYIKLMNGIIRSRSHTYTRVNLSCVIFPRISFFSLGYKKNSHTKRKKNVLNKNISLRKRKMLNEMNERNKKKNQTNSFVMKIEKKLFTFIPNFFSYHSILDDSFP